MHLTWFDANSWLFEFGQQRLLVDPWLIGPLVFGNLPWFFIGKRPKQPAIPDNIDLILLSQGLPDHAHPPTLTQLDRDIPVVASASATKVVKKLGYTISSELTRHSMPVCFLSGLTRKYGIFVEHMIWLTPLYEKMVKSKVLPSGMLK